MRVLKIIQDRLEKEKEYNPILFFGIPLTIGLLRAIQTSLLTLASAMINAKLKLFS